MNEHLQKILDEHNINLIELRELCGHREKTILDNLQEIELTQHDDTYKVLVFYAKIDDELRSFDYECNNKKITN